MYLVGFQRILCKILKSEFKFYFKTPILDGLHSPWNRLQMEDSDRRRLGKLDEITKRVDFSLGFFWGGEWCFTVMLVLSPGALEMSSGLLMHSRKPK